MSCTHASAVLHAVCGMKHTFDLTSSNPAELDDDNDKPLLLCTSQPCVCKSQEVGTKVIYVYLMQCFKNMIILSLSSGRYIS